MKKKKVLVLTVVFIAIVFSIARFFQHTGIAPRGYGSGVYVSRVIDGDTIELSNAEKVRYIGIDTPELRERQGSEWIYAPRPYAEEARDFNQRLVEGKSVRLEFDIQKRDRYNRLLAYVYVDDRMVNLEMVREGYAMIYTYPPNVRYVEDFVKAQQGARENERGLWKDLESSVITASGARDNLGMVRLVETDILSTYLSGRVLILNCRDNFKVVIFRNNLEYFPKEAVRSPDMYFKHKTIRVYGLIEEYKGAYEIVLHDPSQIETL